MIRCSLLAALLALPLGVRAADWVVVDTADEHQHSYDRSNLLIEQDTVTFWRRVVFRAPQPVHSGTARMAMYRDSIDCARHTHRSLGYLLYAQDGGVLDNIYTPDAQGEPVVPDTLSDRFESRMCVFVDQVRQSRAEARSELPADASAAEIRARIERLETELESLRSRLRTWGDRDAASAPEGANR